MVKTSFCTYPSQMSIQPLREQMWCKRTCPLWDKSMKLHQSKRTIHRVMQLRQAETSGSVIQICNRWDPHCVLLITQEGQIQERSVSRWVSTKDESQIAWPNTKSAAKKYDIRQHWPMIACSTCSWSLKGFGGLWFPSISDNSHKRSIFSNCWVCLPHAVCFAEMLLTEWQGRSAQQWCSLHIRQWIIWEGNKPSCMALLKFHCLIAVICWYLQACHGCSYAPPLIKISLMWIC